MSSRVMPPNTRPSRPYKPSPNYVHSSLRKRAPTVERKQRREFLKETLFTDGVDPLEEEDIPLPPSRRTPGRSPRMTPKMSSPPRPPSSNNSNSRSPSRGPKSEKRRFSMSRRKSLTNSTPPEPARKTADTEQRPKNKAGKSRKLARRFSMGKKHHHKKRDKDPPSVGSGEASGSSKKSLLSDEDDRRKSISMRAKSDGMVLTAMRNGLQIASESENEEDESEFDEEEEEADTGLLTRGLQRLEQFYEETLNG
eukprot:scaffold791_cov115-Cylindrotheca_fusiformis.AAC.12